MPQNCVADRTAEFFPPRAAKSAGTSLQPRPAGEPCAADNDRGDSDSASEAPQAHRDRRVEVALRRYPEPPAPPNTLRLRPRGPYRLLRVSSHRKVLRCPSYFILRMSRRKRRSVAEAGQTLCYK